MSGRLREPRGQPGYLSYLVRLWQVVTAGEGEALGRPEWRGSLESSLAGERLGFASLDELIGFLQQEMGSVAEATGDRAEEGPDRPIAADRSSALPQKGGKR